ncbi:MAG: hypothetical protein MJ158_03620, partial [Alphaproteobacteria bacterium]|nr:hypothetical protein [Alphaproteobacteria bacterium]
MIKISRRNFLTTFGIATLIASVSPRIVFAGQNILQNIRTGVQPGNKTRIVIETTKRPSYSLSYDTNKLIINLSNTNGNAKVLPVIASGTLISRITQIQNNSTLQIVVGLTSQIDEIQKNQTMILEPNG